MAKYDFMNYGKPADPLAAASYSAVNPGVSNYGLDYTAPADYASTLGSFGAPQAGGSIPPFTVGDFGDLPVDRGALENLPAFSAAKPSLLDQFKNINWLNKSDGKGGTNQGVLSPLISGAGALVSGYLGLKQYGLAKDQFNFQKQAYQTNLANQSKLTNAKLADRQAQRVANNPNSISVADYLQKYGV